ncbi:MAG: hypothetical protein AAB620_00425, partial [Patescibacteria group bacterium]
MKGKLVLVIVIIGTILGGIGLWYWQKNIYSKGLLRLEILAPDQSQLLEEITYTVRYKNTGNTTLEKAKLVFEYPKYAIINKAGSLREEVALQDIYPGEEKSYQFKARLLGKENEAKEAKAVIYYRPKGLMAGYQGQTTSLTVIKRAPLTLEIDAASKMESGREIKFSVNYFSSLDYPLNNLRVKMSYPDGFDFQKSKPGGLDKGEWDVGVLNKAEGGRIEVQGRLSGQLNDEKMFKASLGVWQDEAFIVLKETERAVKITTPSLDVFQRVNGSEDYTAKPGEWLHYEIFFRNTGQGPIYELFMLVKMDGESLSFDTARAEGAQINKDERTMIWDWRETPKLQFLAAGEEGKVEFWVSLKDEARDSFKKANMAVLDSVLISEIQKKFDTKVASRLDFSGRAYFNDEIFGNEGPLPPQAGQDTTYTVVWQADGCCNAVKNVKAKATLPHNVRLTGQIFPEGSRLTFDSASREVVWEVGDLFGAQATSTEPYTVAFQVSLKPDFSQRGKTA